jgi:hypothetical protein|tara:strand:+ start:1359 stop:2549 length:1191 start_codon:yes stop_codon:yes gene_type:complete
MQKKFFFGILIFVLSSSLLSHQRSESYSKIVIDNTEDFKKATLEFSIQTSVLQRLNLNFTQDWEEEFIDEVTENFKLSYNCKIAKSPFLKSSFSTGYITLFWVMDCESKEIEINFDLFFKNDPSHTHIATFIIDSEAKPEKVFTSSDRNWKETDKKTEEASLFQSFQDYFDLGFNHILSGFDHLAFLLALLILNLPIKRLIIIVTGFTIGHSITLALGALDMIEPASQLVEALIGYSIVIIAVETVASITNYHKPYNRTLIYISCLLLIFFTLFGYSKFLIGLAGVSIFSYCYLSLISIHRDFSITFIVTCLFGLIHGFGFAGNLASIGLMEGRLLPAILGFNLGVEFGQILVGFILALLLYYLNKFMNKNMDNLRVYLASGLACIGTFWFLERLL